MLWRGYRSALYAAGLVGSLLCASAFAQDVSPEGLRLGQPTVNGDACNFQNTTATLSPDNLSLSILFSGYKVRAGGYTGVTADHKTCNIVIPVTVPSGYSVSVINIDYRGYNSLAQGTRAQFNAETFFAGQNGVKFERVFYGPLESNFTFTNNVTASTLSWSACGASVNLRTSTTLAASGATTGREVSTSIDSADVSSAIVYRLEWKRCGGGGGVGVGGGTNGGGGGYPTNPGYPGTNPGYPSAGIGACSIQQMRDYRGTLYNVVDRQNRVLDQSYDYNEAYRLAEQANRLGRCDNYGGGVGYPQNPGIGYPSAGIGACTIQQVRDRRGYVYNVVDSQGRYVDQSYDYNQAYQLAEQANRQGRCNQFGGGGIGYPPGPGYPTNPGYPPVGGGGYGGGVGSCQIIQGQAGTGQVVFRVVASSGAVIAVAYDYGQAASIAQRSSDCFR